MMKKLLLAAFLAFAPSFAWAQCSGVFPPGTFCGNAGVSAAAPRPIPASSVVGPGVSVVGHFATWANVTGTLLADFDLFGNANTWTNTNVFNGAVTLGSTATFNGTANFTSTFQIAGATKTFPAGAATLAGLGTSQTFSGNNVYSGTANFTNTVSLNGTEIRSALASNATLGNCTLAASVAANAMTIAVKDASGSDPSSTSPCTVSFRSATAATGTYSVVSITSALSITVPSSATLGTFSTAANRIWVGIFNNAGTPVLGVYNSLSFSTTIPSIKAWIESIPTTGTAITSGSTSAQTWYTASGVTSVAFRIIGFVESTQATAGTWATTPSTVQLMNPDIRRPGDYIQVLSNTATTTGTTTSATFVALTSAPTHIITPISAANLIEVSWSGVIQTSGAFAAQTRLSRGNTAATNLFGNRCGNNSNAIFVPCVNQGFDLPNTTSSTTYYLQGLTSGGTLTVGPATVPEHIFTIREIQI